MEAISVKESPKGISERNIAMKAKLFSLLALLLPLPVAKCKKAVTLPMPEEEAAPVAE